MVSICFELGNAPLRQDRDSAGGKAEAVLYLRPGDDDQRALGRHLVEIGHDLDLEMTVLQNVGLGVHLVVVSVSMDSWPIAVTPRCSIRNLMVSSDHAGNGLRLKRSGSLSQSLYMSVRSAA